MPDELIVQTKLENFQKKSPLPPDIRLWVETLVYSIIILLMVCGYYLVTQAEFTGRTANRAVADVSFLLMGFSLALSSFCYFWNFADRFIIYRKHLGLVGFGYLLVHVLISLFLAPYTPFADYYLADDRIVSFGAALIATIVFTGMTLISNRLAIHEIGPQLWRKLMRLGYIAYALTLVHFGLKGGQYWIAWFLGKSDSLFPSFGLIVFLFGVSILLLRTVLWVSLMNKQTTNETNNS